jgi:lysophospholipase L1-like esterase
MTRLTFLLPLLLLAAPALADDDGARVHLDWGYLAKYRDQNAGKIPDVVFMGDSITEVWISKRPGFFSDKRLDRGISGQTTQQMLVRFGQDVVALHPKVVQIMGGTNDIAGNTGPMTPDMTKDAIAGMVAIAKANHIKVLLASIPPADHFAWRPGLEVTDKIIALNDWIKSYAAKEGVTYVDYWSAMQNGKGGMKDGYAMDGVHPTEQGYDVMASVIEPILKQALSGR